MSASFPSPGQAPVEDEDKAREIARVAVLRIVVWVLGAILVVLAVVVFSTLILRGVKGGGAPASGTRPVAAALPAAQGAAGPAASALPDVRAALPPGGRVVATSLGEGRLAVTVEAQGTTTVILFDLATLAETGRIVLAPR
jgi:hypothetical protein